MVCQRSSNHKLKAIHNRWVTRSYLKRGVSKIVKSQIESNSQQLPTSIKNTKRCVKDRQITNWKQFTTWRQQKRRCSWVCQRSSNHKLKAIHNRNPIVQELQGGVSKIVKSQIESNSQPVRIKGIYWIWCVKDRQITNWKQFTTALICSTITPRVCQRSSNHKLKAIHNNLRVFYRPWKGVSKIVKSQIESNSQQSATNTFFGNRCVKDRQITNWKQFTTLRTPTSNDGKVCQRSSNHKLKAIHNTLPAYLRSRAGVSKIVKSQIESNLYQWT